jgi:tetratricopeptide (TPR) repeat protein
MRQSETDVSIMARAILGGHKNYRSFAEAKYEQHVQQGWRDLEGGRYYRAAEAFRLAASYRPKDPEPLAGRGLALFAAGEYVSSALFISRAIEMSGRFASRKIDLEAIWPDKDKLEDRIIDARKWQTTTGSTELLFLLCYIYYQRDMLEEAASAAERLCEAVRDWPAAAALKEAIDRARQAR